MIPPTKQLLLLIAVPVIALLAACGGNVVVDGSQGSGTATTQTGSGGGVTTEPGAGGASCFNLPPPSALSLCGGSGSGGSCQFSYCDGTSNDWEADCTGSACQCRLNGMELCTCALSVEGDICSGTPDCCFNK